MSVNCANCGRTLGALETVCRWGEHAVCVVCYRTLSQQPREEVLAAPDPGAAPAADAEYYQESEAAAEDGLGVCASCGGTIEPHDLTTNSSGQPVCMMCEMGAAARPALSRGARRRTVSAKPARPVRRGMRRKWKVITGITVVCALTGHFVLYEQYSKWMLNGGTVAHEKGAAPRPAPQSAAPAAFKEATGSAANGR